MPLRSLPTGWSTYLDSDFTHIFFAVDLDFEGDPFRAHQDVGDITIGGNVFTGVGDLGEVGEIDENQSLRPDKLSLKMNGLNDELVAKARATAHQGRACTIYICGRDVVDGTLLEAHELWRGFMDTMPIQRAGGQSLLNLTLADERHLFDLPLGLTFSPQWYQQISSTSTALNRVSRWTEAELDWGPDGVDNQSGGGAGGGFTGIPGRGRPY